jgi:hypothetical protein
MSPFLLLLHFGHSMFVWNIPHAVMFAVASVKYSRHSTGGTYRICTTYSNRDVRSEEIQDARRPMDRKEYDS